MFPAKIYLFKVNNRNTRKRCEICSKLTIKTPSVFIVKFEHISYLFLVFLLSTLNQVNVSLEGHYVVCKNNFGAQFDKLG